MRLSHSFTIALSLGLPVLATTPDAAETTGSPGPFRRPKAEPFGTHPWGLQIWPSRHKRHTTTATTKSHHNVSSSIKHQSGKRERPKAKPFGSHPWGSDNHHMAEVARLARIAMAEITDNDKNNAVGGNMLITDTISDWSAQLTAWLNAWFANTQKANQCPNGVVVRKEWRTLSAAEKGSYIAAVKCLATKPSMFTDGRSTRLYDDFEQVHVAAMSQVHFVAAFLPWHRRLVYLYHQALQGCGYTGAQVHWDWTQDAADFRNSPVWSSDPVTGLGTNGQYLETKDNTTLDAGVVADGAFAKWVVMDPQVHHLERNFAASDPEDGHDFGNQFYDTTYMKSLYAMSSFNSFRTNLENDPHGSIHEIIGGDMAFLQYAANDPMFFLHHTHVDYIWAKWQSQSRSRLTAYAGNRNQTNPNANDASLSDMLPFMGWSTDVPVSSVMDSTAYPYCYTYTFLPNS